MATKTGAIDAAPETATANDDGGSLGLNSLTALMGAGTPLPAEPDEEEAPEEPQEEPAEEPEEESTDTESILERLGLADLSEEERRELNKELGGRAAERFAELTARAEAAKAEADKLRAELAKREPFKAKPNNAENPYRDKSIEELEEIHAAAIETIRNGRAILDEHDDSHNDDEIGEFGGKMLTKREVKAMVRRAEEAKDVHIPARADEIRQLAGIEATRQQNMELVKKVHPWVADESSEMRKAYDSVVGEIESVFRKDSPHLLPHMAMVLADHTAAHFQRLENQNAPNATRKPLVATKKAPPAPNGAGAAPSRPTGRTATRKAAEEQFAESRGGVDDLARLFMR